MELINNLLKKNTLKDNLHDVNWIKESSDPEIAQMSYTLHSDTCENCGGFVIGIEIDDLRFNSNACMKCGKYWSYDEENSTIHDYGGGFGAIQLVTKDRSTVLNYSFEELNCNQNYIELMNEITNFPNVDLEHSFITMRGEYDYLYWIGVDIRPEFYEKLLGKEKTKESVI